MDSSMYSLIFSTHKIVVTVFVIIYLMKTFFLLTNKLERLEAYTKKFKIPEMVVSFLFLLTGIALLVMGEKASHLQYTKFALVFIAIPMAIIGFKKQKKGLAITSFICLILAYGLAEMNAKIKRSRTIDTSIVQNATAPDYDIQIHGKAVYTAQCQRCHGEKGDANISGAKDLSVSKLTDTKKLTVIKMGKNNMTGFKGTLNETEINATLYYINSLHK